METKICRGLVAAAERHASRPASISADILAFTPPLSAFFFGESNYSPQQQQKSHSLPSVLSPKNQPSLLVLALTALGQRTRL
jgi:hypothetical protein